MATKKGSKSHHSTGKGHGSKGSAKKTSGGTNINYANDFDKHGSKSTTGRSAKFKKNVLDDFFKGFDRGEAIYDEFKSNPEFVGYAWDPERILNTEGITLSRLTSKVLNVSRININHTPSQVDFTNFGKMYAFFTKPDLYLFTDDKFNINQTIKDNAEDLYAKIKRNIPVASALQIGTGKVPSYGASGGLNTLLGNLCNEIEVPEVQMSTTPGPKNGKGTSISYVGDFFESLQEGSINISFIDTRDRDVSTQLDIWATYAEMQRRGVVFKKPDYIGKNIIDYACTIFILCVDESNNIQGIIPLIGCFPTTINTELLKYRATQLVAQDFIGPFNWTFHVSYVGRPNSQKAVEAFNYVTGFGEKVLRGADMKTNPHKLLYKKKGDWWFHTGVTMDIGYITEYPYHFSLEDKWAEMVGITYSLQSSGVVNYTLAFCSRNLGDPVSRTGLWKGRGHYGEEHRWKKEKAIRVNPATGKTEYYDANLGSNEDRSGKGLGAVINFGALDFTPAYEPYTFAGASDSASHGGTYQGNWDKWNTGSNRYGSSTNVSSTNNSNRFANALRTISGLRF